MARVGGSTATRVAVATRYSDSSPVRRTHGKARSLRVTRRPSTQSQQADVVVDAVVHARLFGRFELLTLDARVFVASPDAGETWEHADGVVAPRSATTAQVAVSAPRRMVTEAAMTRDRGLDRALELLDDGAQLLEQVRKMTIQEPRAGRARSSR